MKIALVQTVILKRWILKWWSKEIV